MKIEVGKTYRTRSGVVTVITEDDGAHDWPLRGDSRIGTMWYNREGVAIFGTPDDSDTLVEELCDGDGMPFVPGDVRTASGGETCVSTTPTASIYKDINGTAHAVRDDIDVVQIDRDATRTAITRLRSHSLRQWIAICLLALAVIFFANDSQAGDIAWMPNAVGGEIVLTNDQGSCSDLYLLAYSRGPDGTVITGCWLIGTRYVMIRWSESQRVVLFKPEQFQAFDVPVVAPAKRTEMRL